VKAKGNDGLRLDQKVSNEHLPCFLASTCLGLFWLTKVFPSLSIHDHLPSPVCNHLPRHHFLNKSVRVLTEAGCLSLELLHPSQPYGFDVEPTFPTRFWLSEVLRHLDRDLLTALLASTVQALYAEIPGLGETVASMSSTSMPGSRRTTNAGMSHNATTTSSGWQATPIAHSASSAALIRNCLMAQPKRRRKGSGAMALAWLQPSCLTTAMWCSLSRPNPLTKAM